MYNEGFKWWNLGSASAIAFLLFAIMFAVTAGMFAVGPPRRRCMSPRMAKAIINGLLAGGALVALFPLLWMLSVSLMHPGEAGALPPAVDSRSCHALQLS